MKLLPHSNGFYKVNMKRELKPKDIVKNVVVSILVILLIGFIYSIIIIRKRCFFKIVL